MPATRPGPHTLIDELNRQFPAFRDGLPLALGIHKVIKERMPDIDVAQLRLAMKAHTASFCYLKAVATGKQRVDLDGNPVEELTDEHREVAAVALRDRIRRAAERRRADEKIKKEQEEHAQRAAKLAQLAARFNSR